ncbi:MAG: hypothetical protein R2941_15905 [Desulfobacterales bacterium]
MQQYDIAAKVLIESCRDELIREFIGIEISESSMIENLPQETVSLKRSDFPVIVTDTNGKRMMVILEILTRWSWMAPLNLLDYRTRYLLKNDMEVISCIILLMPSGSASDIYEDNEVRFSHRLVKIYEADARKIISEGPVCLLPFVPLMKHGKELVSQADSLIYRSGKPRKETADMLTSMAILSGLISAELPAELIARRRDIMIESAAYDIIKNEGRAEGRADGKAEGIQLGIREGILRSAITLLEVKFGANILELYREIKKIQDNGRLEEIIMTVKAAKSPEEVLAFIRDTE